MAVGMGKYTVPVHVAAGVVVQELVLPPEVAAVAARSWLRPPGTIVPRLPSWPPGFAAVAAALGLAVAECTMVAVDMMSPQPVVEEAVPQHREWLVAQESGRVLASLHCCC